MVDYSGLIESFKDKKVKFITCDVVYDEIKSSIPDNWDVSELEKKLHEKSDILREELQKEIDISQQYDLIILGYGLCGKSVDGLISKDTYIIIPKCDDCIAMLLGSTKEYKKQFTKEPGTYYLTRGYIGDIESSFLDNYEDIRNKYDQETWDWFLKEMMKNYKRLVYINTGNYDPAEWREKAKQEADKLGLEFEEIQGTNEIFDKILALDIDDEFLLIKPGNTIKTDMFTI
jgi:hypothetical protein